MQECKPQEVLILKADPKVEPHHYSVWFPLKLPGCSFSTRLLWGVGDVHVNSGGPVVLGKFACP